METRAVNLKCKDNLMDIRIKLNPVRRDADDKSTSVRPAQSSDSKLLKHERSYANSRATNSSQATLTDSISTAAPKSNSTARKPMNSEKSINPLSRAEVDSIKRPIEANVDKSNSATYRPHDRLNSADRPDSANRLNNTDRLNSTGRLTSTDRPDSVDRLADHPVVDRTHKLISGATSKITNSTNFTNSTTNTTNATKPTNSTNSSNSTNSNDPSNNSTNLTNQLTNRASYKTPTNKHDDRLPNSGLIVADAVVRSKRSENERSGRSTIKPPVSERPTSKMPVSERPPATEPASKRRRVQISKIYFEGWKDVPHCLPEIISRANNETNLGEEDRLFHFQLALQPADDSGLNCGLTRMRNKITDDLDYQHTILIEYDEMTDQAVDGQTASKRTKKRDALLVHCRLPKANFFQSNQLLWWSSRIRQQMLDQQRQFEQRLLSARWKATNRSDNKQNERMTRSDFTSEHPKGEQLTFDNGRPDKLDSNLSMAIEAQSTQPSAQSSTQSSTQPAVSSQQRVKRASPFLPNALPENFTESVDELIDYSGEIQGKTPVPKIHIVVRQHGQASSPNSSLEVLPGTPLEMMIYLDKESANVYGLLVSYLKVTDNNFNKAKPQEEVIILDGCSIDPYIFGNFVSADNGKSILARFRAFRFPGSMFVLFVSTVTVCIGQCRPVPDCAGSDQPAYGRRRRDLNAVYANGTDVQLATTTLPPSLVDAKSDFELKVTNRRGRKLAASMPADVNKVFEVEMSTIIRVTSPKPVSGLMKNEYRHDEESSTVRTARPNTRPITVRKMKKRYDANQSLNKLSQSYSFKTAPISAAGELSCRLALCICLSRFAFSALALVFLSTKKIA